MLLWNVFARRNRARASYCEIGTTGGPAGGTGGNAGAAATSGALGALGSGISKAGESSPWTGTVDDPGAGGSEVEGATAAVAGAGVTAGTGSGRVIAGSQQLSAKCAGLAIAMLIVPIYAGQVAALTAIAQHGDHEWKN